MEALMTELNGQTDEMKKRGIVDPFFVAATNSLAASELYKNTDGANRYENSYFHIISSQKCPVEYLRRNGFDCAKSWYDAYFIITQESFYANELLKSTDLQQKPENP